LLVNLLTSEGIHGEIWIGSSRFSSLAIEKSSHLFLLVLQQFLDGCGNDLILIRKLLRKRLQRIL